MTTQTKHTPGNWSIMSDQPGPVTILTRAYPRKPIGYINTWGCSIEWMANARLIAAAPDLLKASKDLLEFAEWYGQKYPSSYEDFSLFFEDIRNAIAKATGQS